MLTDLASSLSRSRRPLALLSFAVALAAVACKPVIAGGGIGGGGDGTGASNVVGGGGTGGIAGPSAIAEPYWLYPPSPGPGSSSSGGGTGGAPSEPDLDTLYIRIGDEPKACGSGFAGGCAGGWQVTIGLPPDKQYAGGLWSLNDPTLTSTFEESGYDGSNDQDSTCWFGGGTFWVGNIFILSNDGGQITVRLSGTNTGIGDFEADGDYVAPICQWTEPG